MARTPKSIILYPDEDVDTGWTATGGDGTQYDVVNEGVDSADDDTSYLITTSDLAVQTLGVNPFHGANLNETVDVSARLRYRNSDKWADDTHDIRVRILKGATQLSTQTFSVASTSYATANTIAAANGITLTQAELNDLRIELRFDRTAVGGSDGAGLQVTACELFLTYVPRSNNVA